MYVASDGEHVNCKVTRAVVVGDMVDVTLTEEAK